MLPGMGSSDDDDMYTVYQMDPSTSSMLAYESYDTFDVMAVDEYGVGQLVSLGAKKGTFRMPHPLAMVEAAPKYETLPTETLKTRYLKPITKTTYLQLAHSTAARQAGKWGRCSSWPADFATTSASLTCCHCLLPRCALLAGTSIRISSRSRTSAAHAALASQPQLSTLSANTGTAHSADAAC